MPPLSLNHPTPTHTPKPPKSNLSGRALSPRVYVTVNSSSTPTSSAGEATSSSILAQAEASTHLSWWQLLALILGSVLAVSVGVWLWWRHRKKVRADVEKKKEIEEREKARIEGDKERELEEKMRAMKGKGRGKKERGKGRKKREESEESEDESEEWSESGSESDDSVSDGGTIYPSRTRRRRYRARQSRRDRYRHRRRRYSDTETDWSDETYYPRRHHRYRDPYRDDRYYDPPPARGPPPQEPAPNPPRSFRDSVFSSYNSMKKAAVRLKYVEAKVKLKKQLEEEERLEKARRDKVKEANKEIEEEKKWESGLGKGSAELLIPAANRSTNHSSSTSSTLPVPPDRNRNRERQRQQQNRQNRQSAFRAGGSLDTLARPPPSYPSQNMNARQLYPPKNHTIDTIRPGPREGRKDTGELGDEISQLLGNSASGSSSGSGRSPATRRQGTIPIPPPPAQAQAEPQPQPPAHGQDQSQGLGQGIMAWFQRQPAHPQAQPSNPSADDLEIPLPGPRPQTPPAIPSVPETAKTSSVYLDVTDPRNRPVIPRGGLAPAPAGRGRKGMISPSVPDVPSVPGVQKMSEPVNAVLGSRVPGAGAAGAGEGGGGGGMAGVGAGGGKWANRLRAR
ncbi:hypothetical protein I350_02516 [Cryptococcus amylolentus CBS 6273]|uniref:Uncharacterized protein n=1 Tax=Cryptococcus amylolentus CBS 6273 TaxID=1296118 RepID=A0A1E3KCH8_9TREE|nr:hypothetical protein I350_02516 [Cryptococcus amylolentus CBS 6273]